jgi:hypothetical protein
MGRKPDWRNPEDYARMKNFTPSQWAWEFLRRNLDYVKAYNRNCRAFFKYVKDPDQVKYEDLAVEWGIANGYHDPEKDNSDIEWLPAAGIGFTMTINFPPAKKGSRHTVGRIMPNDAGYVPATFNVYQPIKPQIDAVKEELQQIQKELKVSGKEVRKAFKPRRDEWITLLRVLDADADAEVPKQKGKEIASLLFTGIDEDNATAGWVYDKRKQAVRYVTRDYRLLPYSEK